MQAIGRQHKRAPDGAPVHCERHRPEQTALNRLVQQHAATFIAHTEASTGGDPSMSGPLQPAGWGGRSALRLAEHLQHWLDWRG